MTRKNYLSPAVQVIQVTIEKGFAASQVNDYAPEGCAGSLEEGETYEF